MKSQLDDKNIQLDNFTQQQHIHKQSNGQYLQLAKTQLDNLQYLQKAKPHHNQSQYRPDIDGLRTIAVSIVIYFHMYPQIMIGGFIGVDIFFVISGYLISSIIIKQTIKNKFSYFDFYSRRVKRIYPALLIVLVAIIVMACLQFDGRQLHVISDTMAAATVFGANLQVLSYNKSYFDPDVKKNPLLHLWSLGVQQQFYIIWPIILFLIIRKFKNKSVSILTLFTIFSFTSNIIAVYVYQNPKFAFYFPICRFWQMAIGGLISYTSIKIKNKIISNSLSMIGTCAILITVWIVNQNSLFPGFWALIPTISGAFIILGGSQALINKYILSNKIVVFIGKISYPLYLWHWPLLVFSRILYPSGSESIFATAQMAILMTIILSIFTYYFIQNPLRFSKSKNTILLLLISMLLITCLSLSMSSKPEYYSLIQRELLTNYQNDIVPDEYDYYIKNGKKLVNTSKNKNRLKADNQKVRLSLTAKHQQVFELVKQNSIYYDQTVKNNVHYLQILNQGQQNKVFLIGDSHTEHIRPRFIGLYEQKKKENKLQQFPTILSLSQCSLPFDPCFPFYYTAMQYIKAHKPNRVFLKNRWIYWFQYDKNNTKINTYSSCQQRFKYPQRQSYQDLIESFKKYTKSLKQLIDMGIEVYVGTISPEGDEFDPRRMRDFFGVIQDNVKPIKLSKFKQKNKQIIQLLQTTMIKAGVKIVDFADHQCWQDVCEVLVPKGYPYFTDTNHFRYIYSKYWASSLDFLVDFQKQSN